MPFRFGGLRARAKHGPMMDARLPPLVEHHVRLPGGRALRVAEYGDRSPLPMLYLHGFLGSRLEPRPAGGLGYNLIAIDRPGYGGSAPLAMHSLASFGRDFEAALDQLGIERCGLIGVSAGGPYAVAAATVLGPRITRLVLVGAVADSTTIAAGGGAVQLFDRLQRQHGVVRMLLPRLVRRAVAHGLDVRFVRRLLHDEQSRFAADIDRTLIRHNLLSSLREGLQRSATGLAGDIDLLTRAWDIDPGAVRVPVTLMHGTADTVVPLAHARWYARSLPTSRLELHPGEGHVSLVVNQARAIFERLSRPD